MTDLLTMPLKRVPTSKQLKSLRERLGLTQTVMAEKFNVPLRTYTQWEYGERTPSAPVAIIYEMLLQSLEEK